MTEPKDSTRQTRRNWLGLAVGGGAAALGGWWSSSRFNTPADDGGQSGAISGAIKLGEAVGEDFWALSFDQPDGQAWRMGSLQGHAALINFWATWCPPCVRELPQIDRFYRDYSTQGWKVLGLAIDSAKPVGDFLARQPLGFTVALGGVTGADLSRLLGNRSGALPFSLILDPQGRIAWRKLGETSYEELVGQARSIKSS